MGTKWFAAMVVAALAVASCSSDPGPEWGAEATEWTDSLPVLLYEEGGRAWDYLWAPGFTMDFRSMVPGSLVLDRHGALVMMSSITPPQTDAFTVEEEHSFIDTEGMILFNRIDWAPSGSESLGPATAVPGQLANLLGPIGPDGVEHMISAFATDSWRERYDTTEVPDQADALADSWVATWNNGGHPGFYTADATITDSIAGLTANGPEGIAGSAAGDPHWVISTLSDTTRQVYGLLDIDVQLYGVVLVVDAADPESCPSTMAVALTVDDERVTTEKRYWLVEEARRCSSADDLPTGWWSDQRWTFEPPPAPTEDLETVTGSLDVDGNEIEVRNGNEQMDAFIEWGLGRFQEAGLRLPVVGSITFTEYSRFCEEGIEGRSIRRDGLWNLYLCLEQARMCLDDNGCETYALSAQRLLIHELAHAWIAQNLTTTQREQFTARLALEVWADPYVEWDQQGQEHAAETIAWGLVDGPMAMMNIGIPSTEQLRDQFIELTGVEPLQAP